MFGTGRQLGGFVYFDNEMKFIQANSLSLKPSSIGLWLEGPYEATEAATTALRQRGR